MIVPCKICADRKVGCHASCQKYKEWKAMLDAGKAKSKRGQETDAYWARSVERIKKRAKLGK